MIFVVDDFSRSWCHFEDRVRALKILVVLFIKISQAFIDHGDTFLDQSKLPLFLIEVGLLLDLGDSFCQV